MLINRSSAPGRSSQQGRHAAAAQGAVSPATAERGAAVYAQHCAAGYRSDMPGYAGVLSDEEIWAVLAYINSHLRSAAQGSERALDAGRSSGDGPS